MIIKHTIAILSLGGTLLISQPLLAEEQHHHESHHGAQHHEMPMTGTPNMFLQKRQIDGFQVSFHVMAAQQGMEHGGSHNLMIKIEQHGKVVDRVRINSKVIYPDGRDESKPLMKMGEWYMNGYDLAQQGQHQLMILFKTPAGSTHKGGVYYAIP